MTRNRHPSVAAYGRLLRCATTNKKQRICSKNLPLPVSKLQDDLLVEILVRLPDARSAFRCKPVCKRWSSLISSPYFRGRFVSHHQQSSRIESGDNAAGEPSLLLSTHDAESVMSFLPVPDDIRRQFLVLSSSKDLVLCGFSITSNKCGGKNRDELRRLFFVCNPFTKQWIALPLAPERSTEHETFSMVSLVSESGDGKGQVFIDRFRVVHVSGTVLAPNVDLFCSESGEWTKEVVDLGQFNLRPLAGKVMAWCNGQLYWRTVRSTIAVWNPFCPNTPPSSIDAVRVVNQSYTGGKPQVWASQGALHLVYFTDDTIARRSSDILSVWRLGDEGTWKRLHQVSLRVCKFVGLDRRKYTGLKLYDVRALHPSDPEIVFLEFSCDQGPRLVFSLNIRTRDLTFFLAGMIHIHWRVFHPSFTCWPSPIPSYEKLRGYDGSYSWVVQSIESTQTPATTTECRLVQGVERFGRPRKRSRSSSQLGRLLKKQKLVRCIARRLWMNERKSNPEVVDAVRALQAIPDIDDELCLDACDLFEDDNQKAGIFLALDGRIRKKWLLRKLCRKEPA